MKRGAYDRRVQGSGCRVQGAGFRVQGAGCRVQGSGCWVLGSGFARGGGMGGGRERESKKEET